MKVTRYIDLYDYMKPDDVFFVAQINLPLGIPEGARRFKVVIELPDPVATETIPARVDRIDERGLITPSSK